MQRLALSLFCAGALLIAPVAQAGLFDDDVARQQIVDLQAATNARVETLTQAQLELSTQLLGLREEIARLRGEIETLHYESEQAKKRLQDLYLDLDSRLTPLESRGVPGNGAALAVDPAVENNAYESALNQFKAGKYPAAATAFAAFVKNYPDSEMAPSAQFWLGNAWYAQQKCKQAIEAQQVVATRWSDSTRAPDALLAIANCQRDDGNTTAARRTLNTILEKYPTSQAATQAKQRLK